MISEQPPPSHTSRTYDAVAHFVGIKMLLTWCIVLGLFVWFVTSSDSGSLVIDMLTSGGELDPPRVQRVFWAVAEGFVAVALLVSGGLGALQTASIATGLLFSVVMLLMIVSLLKAFRDEPINPTVRDREPKAPSETYGDVEHPRGAD